MTIHKYAFMTEFQTNLYEVFFIARLDDSVEMENHLISKYDLALSSGNTISGMNATGKSGLLRGSTWDGNEFSLPSVLPSNLPDSHMNGMPSVDLEGNSKSYYVLLDGNTVFFTLAVITGSSQDNKLDAAFSNNVTLKKIEESDGVVSLGMIWDGSSWSIPQA